MDMQFSSDPDGNLTMNFDPAFSSELFNGLNRQTTLILSSAAISRSPDMITYFHNTTYTKAIILILGA